MFHRPGSDDGADGGGWRVRRRGRAGSRDSATQGGAGAVGRIAAGAEMIIAAPGGGTGRESPDQGVRRDADEGEREITTGVRRWAGCHDRGPAQRRYLGISQFETVT
jgi:hypothetical protein